MFRPDWSKNAKIAFLSIDEYASQVKNLRYDINV